MCQIMSLMRVAYFSKCMFLKVKFVGSIFCTIFSPHFISLFTHDSGVLSVVTALSQLESSFEWFYLAFSAGKEWRGTTTSDSREGKQSLAEASLSIIKFLCTTLSRNQIKYLTSRQKLLFVRSQAGREGNFSVLCCLAAISAPDLRFSLETRRREGGAEEGPGRGMLGVNWVRRGWQQTEGDLLFCQQRGMVPIQLREDSE